MLTLVGLSRGFVEDTTVRTRGIGADIIVRSPDASIGSLALSNMPEKLVDRLEKIPHVTMATGVASHLVSGWTAVSGIDVPKFEKMSGGFTFREGHGFERPDDILVDTYFAQQAKVHASSGDMQVFVAKSPQAMMFYMDTTKPPFNDNRVRQAIRLIADRQALVDSAISGYGTVGNDIVGKGLPFYDDALPQRVQDIAKAKSLLKAAGQENLNVELQTSDIFPGFVEAATLLAQQAKAAGVTIKLKQVPPNSYYNPSLLYLKMLFAETQWPIVSLKFFYLQALASNAPYNETHWHSKSWNTLLFKAIGELDHAKAQSYWNQAQKIQYDSGGYLNWTNADWVDGLSKKVRGLKPSAAGVLGNYRFLDAWLSG